MLTWFNRIMVLVLVADILAALFITYTYASTHPTSHEKPSTTYQVPCTVTGDTFNQPPPKGAVCRRSIGSS